MLFISKYPCADNEKDGMMQRIKVIDNAFNDVDRIYLDISFRKNLVKKTNHRGNVVLFKVNIFIHSLLIIQLLIQAKIIYIHSVYNAIRVIPVFFFKKIIVTDMHGAVPEELNYCNKILLSLMFSIVEKITIKRSWKIISVTWKMSEHFTAKYNRDLSADLVIPIINLNNINTVEKKNKLSLNNTPLVIYSGGVLKWQNISLMLSVVKKITNFRYLFLTGEPKVLQQMAVSEGINTLDIQSVSPEKVYEFYEKSDFGFLLRDNHLLNTVACPTKAIEYISTGVIPIVLYEDIGDLKTLGYRYITLNAFLDGILPDQSQLNQMRAINIKVTNRMAEMMRSGLSNLRNICGLSPVKYLQQN